MSKPERRVTIIDIARDAGVSKSTVSLVLTRSSLVKPATRAAVERSMASLGYVYNRAAAGLRNAQSRLVGLVVSDMMNPFFSELLGSIEQALDGEGYVPILVSTGERRERQAEVLRTLREHGVAGLLLTAAHGTQPGEIAACVPASVPLVTIMRRVPGSAYAHVGPDNRVGAEAVAHLVGLGHRRIAFLGGFEGSAALGERLSGFTAALADAGLPFDSRLVYQGEATRAGGAAQAEQALAARPRPTALFCYNDIVAIGALATLSRRGIEAGRDVAVVGFDDILESRHSTPALTTVSVDTDTLGRQAGLGLARLIDGADPADVSYRGGTRLVIRDSCGAEQKHRVLEEAR